MPHLIRNVAFVACLILSSACFAQETYTNPTLGFSIRKPSSWHYLTAEAASREFEALGFR